MGEKRRGKCTRRREEERLLPISSISVIVIDTDIKGLYVHT